MPKVYHDFAELRAKLPGTSVQVYLDSHHIESSVLFQDPSCELSSGIKSLHALFIRWGCNTWEKLLWASTPGPLLHPRGLPSTSRLSTGLSSPPHLRTVSFFPKEGLGLTEGTSKGPEKGVRPRIPWFASERPVLSGELGFQPRESPEPGRMRVKEGRTWSKLSWCMGAR